MKLNGITSILIILGLMCPPVLSYRPYITEDATVSPAGAIILETSWDYLQITSDNFEHDFLLVPAYGVSDRLEVSLEIPFILLKERNSNITRGIGDFFIVGKYLLKDEGRIWPSVVSRITWKSWNGDAKKRLGTGRAAVGVRWQPPKPIISAPFME
ncbi:MAG: hypothetical protein Kow0042_28690 [Calditrichia bacterium]